VAQTPEPPEDANTRPNPVRPRFPKRGAIPSPRAEIERAKQYIPETAPPAEQPAKEPASAEDIDHQEDNTNASS